MANVVQSDRAAGLYSSRGISGFGRGAVQRGTALDLNLKVLGVVMFGRVGSGCILLGGGLLVSAHAAPPIPRLLWVDLDQDGAIDLVRFLPGGPAQFLLNDGHDAFESVSQGFDDFPSKLNDALVVSLSPDEDSALVLANSEQTFVVSLAARGPAVLARLPGANSLSSCDFDQDLDLDLILDGRVFAQTEGFEFEALAMPDVPWAQALAPTSGEAWEKEPSPTGSEAGRTRSDARLWAGLRSTEFLAGGAMGPSVATREPAADPPAPQGPSVSGNVGINIASPRSEVHVGRNPGSAEDNSRIWVTNDIASDVGAPAEIVFDRQALSGSQLAAVGVDGSERDFYIWMNGADRIKIDENGVTRSLASAGDAAVAIDPSGLGGVIRVLGPGESSGLTLLAREGVDNGASVYGYDSQGTMTFELDADGGGGTRFSAWGGATVSRARF